MCHGVRLDGMASRCRHDTKGLKASDVINTYETWNYGCVDFFSFL